MNQQYEIENHLKNVWFIGWLITVFKNVTVLLYTTLNKSEFINFVSS